jgi:hypothetical protein
MLFVPSLTDRNQEFAGLPAANPINSQYEPLVAVGPLIERPREPNARLNGLDMTVL